MTGAAIVAQARALLGTPWRHAGRDETGLDCIGLVLVAARRAGLTLPDPPPYRRQPVDHALRRAVAEHLDPIADPREGDLLIFNMGAWAGHLGLYAIHPVYAAPACIHAFLPRRQVVEELLGPMRPMLTGAWRWRGV